MDASRRKKIKKERDVRRRGGVRSVLFSRGNVDGGWTFLLGRTRLQTDFLYFNIFLINILLCLEI